MLMILAKLATVDLLKIKLFWNKDYDFIVYVHDVNNIKLSHYSNFIVDVVMWLKFFNTRHSMRQVILTSIL